MGRGSFAGTRGRPRRAHHWVRFPRKRIRPLKFKVSASQVLIGDSQSSLASFRSSRKTIVALAILGTGVVLMRFRKRWLARLNIAVTNRITSLLAGSLPGIGILTHVGRKSGKVYRTQVNVFRLSNGFIIALTYSSHSEWVKNVLPAGRCELKTRGKTYPLSAPKVVRDRTRRRFPIPARLVLRLVGADEYMGLPIR